MTKLEKHKAEMKRYSKLAKRNKAANKLKKTRVVSSAGIKFEKSASVQHKTVDGVVAIRQPMKGKQKQYRTSKPLI